MKLLRIITATLLSAALIASAGCGISNASLSESSSLAESSSLPESQSFSSSSEQAPPVRHVTAEENADSIPVIMYHHLVPAAERAGLESIIIHTTEEFERQMKLLYDGGYVAVSAAEVAAYVAGELYLPENSVCITFDDGYKSNAKFAAPILEKYGFTGTVFTITKYVDFPDAEYDRQAPEFQYVNYTDIEATAGVLDYQCHTDDLHTRLVEIDAMIILADLLRSRERLETELFAYPINADLTEEVVGAVKAAGFTAAFTTLRRNAVPGGDIWRIPRHTITYPLSDADFMKIIEEG